MKLGSQYGCGVLLNCRMLNRLAFVLDYCSLVIVHVEVVWGREESHDAWEPRLAALAMHLVPGAHRQLQTCLTDGRNGTHPAS
jgi:hypothetical protein